MSKIEVNTVEPQCGTTLTLGASGDTVQLGSGASQTGFGRTGTVDWVTTIQTSTPFTAVSGKGYFINTTSGAITMNLPSSPSVGDIVSVKDYAYKFGTNALTVGRNGSPIGGGNDFNPTYETNGAFLTFIYADAVKGWLLTDESNNTSEATSTLIAATGGTITTSGDYKIHTFTGPGTFCVSAAAGPVAYVDYLIIGAGGGGGSAYAGGAGAGGYRESKCSTTSGCWTASPLATSTSLPVSVQAYPITVGGGGAAGTGAGSPGPSITTGTSGEPSVFSTITSTGGGGGGSHAPCASGNNDALPGGSGGGGGNRDCAAGVGTGGTGNSPPVSPPQGNTGGNGYHDAAVYANGAGGGGASAVGGSIPTSAPTFTNPLDGAGGNGVASSITASPVTRAGGGGGGDHPSRSPGAPGGTGGGGAGGTGGVGGNGTANTGGGAGGGGGNVPSSNGGTGGSGIVIIRYKYQ